MTFEKWGYKFDGPYDSPDSLLPIAGVYAIWCGAELDKLLDVGESDDVKDRVSNHERADCWPEHCTGTISYSAHYMPLQDEEERRKVELQIRILGTPPCGER